jgi:PPM family protein phosphatase
MSPNRDWSRKERELDLRFQPTSDPVDNTTTSLTVDLAASTHSGYVRKNNEDNYLIVRFGRALETLQTNLDESLLQGNFQLTGYGMFVADGMGGRAGGEIASSMALGKLIEFVLDTPDWVLALRKNQDVETVLDRMSQRFIRLDEALREKAEREVSLQGMGTTLTVAGVLDRDLIIGHVGDSRAYLLRDHKLNQLTTDHTLAQALIDAGIASPADPAARSMRHVLTAALGSMGNQMEPQVRRLRLRVGDQLLLCTDGLTDIVKDSAIASVLQEADSAQSACESLVGSALDGGGPDNITVVLGRFGL